MGAMLAPALPETLCPDPVRRAAARNIMCPHLLPFLWENKTLVDNATMHIHQLVGLKGTDKQAAEGLG